MSRAITAALDRPATEEGGGVALAVNLIFGRFCPLASFDSHLVTPTPPLPPSLDSSCWPPSECLRLFCVWVLSLVGLWRFCRCRCRNRDLVELSRFQLLLEARRRSPRLHVAFAHPESFLLEYRLPPFRYAARHR